MLALVDYCRLSTLTIPSYNLVHRACPSSPPLLHYHSFSDQRDSVRRLAHDSLSGGFHAVLLRYLRGTGHSPKLRNRSWRRPALLVVALAPGLLSVRIRIKIR